MSPPATVSPYSSSIYDSGGNSRESFGRAMTSPQRRMDPYNSLGASSYGVGGSPYSATAGIILQ